MASIGPAVWQHWETNGRTCRKSNHMRALANIQPDELNEIQVNALESMRPDDLAALGDKRRHILEDKQMRTARRSGHTKAHFGRPANAHTGDLAVLKDK